MWRTPKTNWQPEDYINIEDFNRIKDNIVYLRTLALASFNYFEFSEPIVDDVNYSDYAYNELWNNLENALQDIIDHSVFLTNIGTKKHFLVFDSYIDYNELNRIESTCVKYRELFTTTSKNVPTLSFTLGRYKEIKL